MIAFWIFVVLMVGSSVGVLALTAVDALKERKTKP